MIIVGDIGNTETKICLVNSKKKVIKKITLNTKNIDSSLLEKYLSRLNIKNNLIKKCLFCSVVPKSYIKIKKFFNKNYKIKCYELKKLNLKKLIKIKVNYKQIGSDRLANAISTINNKDNFIILDFGTTLQNRHLLINLFFRSKLDKDFLSKEGLIFFVFNESLLIILFLEFTKQILVSVFPISPTIIILNSVYILYIKFWKDWNKFFIDFF